jgi:hypothetical protein
MAYAPAVICGTATIVSFVVLYNDREATRGETLGYSRGEELSVARDLVEVTRHGPKSNGYRLVAVWTQQEARKDNLALVSGAKGAKRRYYTLLERNTGGVAPRERIWLHQVRERCQSKAPK